MNWRKIFSVDVLISAIFILVIALSYAAIRSYTNRVRTDFEDVVKRAQSMASRPYKPTAIEVPDPLRKLSYDQYRDIRFQKDKALWKDVALPFQVQFFHPGFIFNRMVSVNETDSQGTRRIVFNSALFDYGKNLLAAKFPDSMGYSGFRLHYPINRDDYFDEFVVFQGTSYFRAIAKEQIYGLSARGLAINCGLREVAEEFPVFEEFWLQKPKVGSKEMTLFALMNSPSVVGAFQFVIRPAETTEIEVRTKLFFRATVGELGVAPLTSMFWYGENSGTTHGDFRPEVHDSDGLLMQNGTGEWIWRPLVNELGKTRMALFEDQHPRGFGLLQRDRDFDHYDDLEALYQNRPSAWVEPIGDWGKGHIKLVELATPDETNDNIVAFWMPEREIKKGDSLEFSYKIHWAGKEQAWPPNGKAVSTRWSSVIGHAQQRRVVIEFAGKQLEKLDADHAVEAICSVQGGATLVEQTLQKNTFRDTWRVVMRLQIQDKNKPVELRCFLKEGNDILTETWTYMLQP